MPILLILMLALVIYVFNGIKKATRNKPLAVTEFSPPEGLRAAELGYIYKQKSSNAHAIAIIFELNRAGAIKVKQTKAKNGVFSPGNFEIEKIETYDTTNLSPYDVSFLKVLFKNSNKTTWQSFRSSPTFGTDYGEVHWRIQQELQKKGYIFFYNGYAETEDHAKAMSDFWPRVPLYLFRGFLRLGSGMSQFITKKSIDIFPQILGFRDYLLTVEKERVDYHADPRNIEKFYYDEKLPYVIALEVKDEWTSELLGVGY